MWSGSDYEFSMAVRQAGRKRQLGLAFAAWLSLALGVYAVIAVISILGLFTGAFAGALGAMIALAAVTDRPTGRTRRVAKIALGANALAEGIFLAVLAVAWLA
jgi:hypothetical protein